MKTTARVCLVLLAFLSIAPLAESQSFGALRRIIQRKYTPEGHDLRMKAAVALRQHGDSNTLRFVIARIRITAKVRKAKIDSVAEVTERIAYLSAKIRKARRAGPGNVNQSNVGELEEKRAELERLNRAVEDMGAFIDAMRESVGAIVKNFPEADKDKALKTMIKAFKKSRDPLDKLVMLRVIISCDSPEVALFLNKLVLSKDQDDRLTALVAAEEWQGLRALRLALICLEDPIWQVRAQSIRILKKVGGKRAAEFLIAALAREDGRLKTDAIVALRYLTGENFRKNEHLWKRWLDQNAHLLEEPTETANAPEPPERETAKNDPIRGTMDAPAKRQQGNGGTGFYGVESTSKHIVYVLDFSGSMQFTGKRAKPPTGGAAPRRGGPNTSKINLNGSRRIDRLASELIRSVNALPKDATFNVVVFTHVVTSWRKKMIFATKGNKKALRDWVVSQGPSGATNLFGGLEEAFKFAGRGSYDQAYGIAADTIFLLSDGSPTAGRLRKTDDILAEMRKINALKRIAIHGISLGRNSGLLRRLAQEHDGQYVEIPD